MSTTASLERLNGQDFFVRRWGAPDLPRMLMLHGFPEYGGAWEDLASYLAPHFHLIAPDQRGYGQSWAPPEVKHYRLSQLVGDMATLLDGKPAVVMGHDWGAAVAYGLAMRHPDLVSHLIVANGVHPVPFQKALAAGGAQTRASQYITWLRQAGSEDALAKDVFARLRGLFAADMDTSWLRGARLELYQREWSRPGRLRAMINWYRASPLVVPPPGAACDMPDIATDGLHIHCPHLLIWGAQDTALLPEATEGLEDFAADLTRIALSGADHWLIHQQPGRIADEVLKWLANHPVDGF